MKKILIFSLCFCCFIFASCEPTDPLDKFEILKQKRLAFVDMLVAGQVDFDYYENGIVHYIIPEEYKNIALDVYVYFYTDDRVTFYFTMNEGILGESSGVAYQTIVSRENLKENGLLYFFRGEKIEDNWYKAYTD